jgi:hypothetical protein
MGNLEGEEGLHGPLVRVCSMEGAPKMSVEVLLLPLGCGNICNVEGGGGDSSSSRLVGNKKDGGWGESQTEGGWAGGGDGRLERMKTTIV